MPDLHHLLLSITTRLMLNLTPGYDARDIVTHSLRSGARAGIAAGWRFYGWAVTAAWMARRMGAVQRGMHWLERFAGAMFIGFGLKLALSDQPPP